MRPHITNGQASLQGIDQELATISVGNRAPSPAALLRRDNGLQLDSIATQQTTTEFFWKSLTPCPTCTTGVQQRLAASGPHSITGVGLSNGRSALIHSHTGRLSRGVSMSGIDQRAPASWIWHHLTAKGSKALNSSHHLSITPQHNGPEYDFCSSPPRLGSKEPLLALPKIPAEEHSSWPAVPLPSSSHHPIDGLLGGWLDKSDASCCQASNPGLHSDRGVGTLRLHWSSLIRIK